MNKILRQSLFFIAIATLFGCGVKGLPQPPLTPPTLGHGEPTYSRATKGMTIQKKKKPAVKDDWKDEWNDSEDFTEEKPQ
ncbi:MAG: hypothetical protein COT73_10870 [Bdellovibrio sp. CG10_big_fil_rev_8_21_14_0_10_47_8]|nr:MAG: hypothetical protein COT73_10870 [Bdellovibrio sp. CG10_big_fil_rev_8_21_14_0_10_47_8]